ncbi:glutamate receptor 2.9 [Spatholobus suberectus]|nr:glutamate receptor 2.9 [Spatholobus suberectus]
MSLIFCFFVLQFLTRSGVLLAHERRSHCSNSIISIGAVLDLSSQMGKHQKIAMEIAVQEFNRSNCSKLDLKIRNSHGNSAQAVARGNVNVRFQLFVL